MKLLATIFLLAALASPAFGQSAMQKLGNSEKTTVAGDSATVGSDHAILPSENQSDRTLANGSAQDSSSVADGNATSYSGGKVLFMKKICWLPFRRATYS
jgi:hypothetical protein